MPTETYETTYIKLGDLKPNPYQPPTRLVLKEEDARRGGGSILRSGLLQIPVGRKVDKGNGVFEFQIGDGWQRHEWFKWLTENGHPEYDRMPIQLRPFSDQDMADLIEETDENKSNLNIIEKAWLWRKYLADFRFVTQVELARRRGVSQGEIANAIRLLDLPVEVQDMIITQEINLTHGRVLLQLGSSNDMKSFAGETIKNKWTVATLDDQVKMYLESQKPKLEMETPAPVITEEEEEEGETYKKPAKKKTAAKVEPTVVSKVEPKKPAAPAPAKIAVNWGRKLVIEEKKDHILLSVMKAGGMPAFKKLEGVDIIAAICFAQGWLQDLEEQWNKEKK
jgi:ParB family chromosome partitioning protein